MNIEKSPLSSGPLTIGFVSIARPTFDVPLAQSVASDALAQIEKAGFRWVGTGDELLMDDSGADRAIDSLAKIDFDLLILMQASFADSTMAVRIAASIRDRRLPILLWAVPDERSNGSNGEAGRLRLNSLCGINLAGHALHLHRLPFDYLLVDADDPQAQKKITQLAIASRARHTLRQTRIGLVGQHPAGFETCDYNPEELSQIFGVEVVPLSLEKTLEAAATRNEGERRPFIEFAHANAHNLDALDQEALAGTAGVYATLKEEASTNKLDGIAVRCWPEFFTEVGCAACGAMSMLNEERIPASCEADVNGTLTSILLQTLSNGPAFVTDLVSIEAESDSGVLWHCGLAPVGMADPEGEICGALHSNRKLPLLFEFPLKPGRVTIARLNRHIFADGHEGYRLVIGGGEMIRAPKAFSGTSGVVRFDRPATDVLQTVMDEGLEHHFCITYGDVREELRLFAKMVKLPVLELT